MTTRERLNDAGYDETFAFKDENLKFIGVSHNYNAIYDATVPGDTDEEFGEMNQPIFMTPGTSANLEDETIVLEPRELDTAIIGITDDGRAVYGYEELVEAFMSAEDWTYEEAVEWIDYNTIRSLPYVQNSPVIMYNIDYMY